MSVDYFGLGHANSKISRFGVRPGDCLKTGAIAQAAQLGGP